MQNLTFFSLIAIVSLLIAFKAELRSFLLMNKVPHSHEAKPNVPRYCTSFLDTTVALPITGHKTPRTRRFLKVILAR